jgi:23S rRNA pseudouridine2605 synthase
LPKIFTMAMRKRINTRQTGKADNHSASYKADDSNKYNSDNRKTDDKPSYNKRTTSSRGERSFDDKPSYNKRNTSSRGERSFDDKPSYNKRNTSSRGERSFDDKTSYNKRSSSSRGERSFDDKPSYNKRTTSSRGERSFDDKPSYNKRTTSSRGERSFDDKPSYNKRNTSSRGERSFDDKPSYNKRNTSSRGERSFDDKPSYNKRSSSSRGDRSFDDKPSYNKRNTSSRGERSFDDKDYKKFTTGVPGKSYGRNPNSKKSQKRNPPNVRTDGIRLNKYIADSGKGSRREADELITAGLVSINGEVVTQLGSRVMPGDVVKYNGELLRNEKLVYLILNKPKDYITTTDDPRERKTVMELIKGACKERIYPVGRLDRNTTGLLLFTNDGALADKIMHPSSRIKKTYMVELNKNLKPADMQQISDGIELEDGFMKVDEIAFDQPADSKRVVGVTIHSGRNRIVRRIFEHLGYMVVKLDRTYYAGLTKRDLPRKRYRMLTDIEVNMLKMFKSH